MCQPIKHRHSIFCILPPYVLRSMVENGSPQQRSRALRTLSVDQTIRSFRAATSSSSARGAGRAGAATLRSTAVEKQRTIYDAKNQEELPGSIVRTEGGPQSGDPAVDEAYDGLGATYDFFAEVFERNSIDDDGMPLNATVHFGKDYDNAFWDGERMVFGDGDGVMFNRFTSSLDVIGHELAHGVTEDEAQLVYFLQAGALNESMSDVFGSLIKQRVLNHTAEQADWLVGDKLFTSKVKGVALRSMKEPGTAFDDPVLGKDPQPGHMKDYVRTYEDNGGVHINSGIPNRAFYFAATFLGGYAWERAGRIWYETLRDSRLRPISGFKRFARLTTSNAERLFGVGGTEAKAVRNAWAEVGINIT